MHGYSYPSGYGYGGGYPAGGGVVVPATNGLLNGLISYWKLDEASGNALDAHGANELTQISGVGAGTGKINGARTFNAGTQRLNIADNAALSVGDIGFTFAGWVNIDTKGADRGIVGKWNATGNQREYTLRFNNATDRFTFFVSSNGSTNSNVSSAGAPTLSTWYFVVIWHDPIANTINLQVNNGTVQSTSHSTGVFNGTAPFQLGGNDSGATQYFGGMLDEWGFWKAVLTADQRTALYNAGAALSYGDFEA